MLDIRSVPSTARRRSPERDAAAAHPDSALAKLSDCTRCTTLLQTCLSRLCSDAPLRQPASARTTHPLLSISTTLRQICRCRPCSCALHAHVSIALDTADRIILWATFRPTTFIRR